MKPTPALPAPSPTPEKPRLFILFVLAAAALFILSAPAFAQTDLYFNSGSNADWHTAGIWSTDSAGSDSVDWTDGNGANLVTDPFPAPGNIDIDVNTDVTVQSLNKITTTNDTFDIIGNGSTFTNSSGVYNVAGGATSRLTLASLSVAGDDTITKTGGGALWFNSSQGVAPTHFDIQAGQVRWGTSSTNWNTATSIHIDAGGAFDFAPGGSGGSFQITGLTGAGNVRFDASNKELVLDIANGETYVFDGALATTSGSIVPRGDIVKNGAGTQILGGVNTTVGDVTVNAGTLGFADGGELLFELEDGGVTNQVLGTGTVNFDGFFRLNIDAITTAEGSWQLVDIANLNETFGSTFNLAFVDGPTFSDQGGGIYTSDDWVFDTGTGTLMIVPEPSVSLLAGLALLYLFVFHRRRSVNC